MQDRYKRMTDAVEIKTLYGGDFRPVSVDSARRYVRFLLDKASGIPDRDRATYIEQHHLRGITVGELLPEEEPAALMSGTRQRGGTDTDV